MTDVAAPAPRQISDEQWAAIMHRLQWLWPDQKPLPAEALDEYLAQLSGFAGELVLRGLQSIADEGAARRPQVGQIRRKCFELQVKTGGYQGAPCTCHVGVAFCRAKHPPEVQGRRRLRIEAFDIVDRAHLQGIAVDPGQYGGELGWFVRCAWTRRWFDDNAAAGRAINDDGTHRLADKPAILEDPRESAQQTAMHLGAERTAGDVMGGRGATDMATAIAANDERQQAAERRDRDEQRRHPEVIDTTAVVLSDDEIDRRARDVLRRLDAGEPILPATVEEPVRERVRQLRRARQDQTPPASAPAGG